MPITNTRGPSVNVPPPVDVPAPDSVTDRATTQPSVSDKQRGELVTQARTNSADRAKPSDSLSRETPVSTRLQSGPTHSPGTVTPTTDFAAVAQLFSSLATQLGSMANAPPPSIKFSLDSALLNEQPKGAPFSPATVAAIATVLSLSESGQIKLPPGTERKLEHKLVGMLRDVRKLPELTKPQQQVVRELATTIKTLVHSAASHQPPRAHALLLEREAIDTSDVSALPAELRDALASALGFVPSVNEQGTGSQSDGGQGPGVIEASAAEAPSSNPTTRMRTAASGVAVTDPTRAAMAAPVAHEEIVIPSPELVKLERSFTEALSSFEGMAIEELIQIVMSQIANDASIDLREQLNEMQAVNKKKQAQREFIGHLKNERAEAQTKLRDDYDRRTQLDPLHDEYIDSSKMDFDAYCERQELTAATGSFGSADGIPPSASDLPQIELSPNTFYAAKPFEVELGRRLNITSGQAAALVRSWEAEPGLRLKWGTLEEWLVGNPAEGGLGLVSPSEQAQGALIDAFIIASDPVRQNPVLSQKYDVKLESIEQLREHFRTKLTPSQQAEGFEAWLAKTDGPALAVGGAGNQGKVDVFFAAMAPSASSPANSAAALAAQFNIDVTMAQGLMNTYAALPESWKAQVGSVAELFSKAPPTGAGLVAGASNNTAKVPAFLFALRARANTPPPISQAEALRTVRDATTTPIGANYGAKEIEARKLVDAAFARIPAAYRDKVELMLKGTVWLQLMNSSQGFMTADKLKELQAQLFKCIDTLAPDDVAAKQAMLDYCELRTAEVKRDCSVLMSTRSGSDGNGAPIAPSSWLAQAGIVIPGVGKVRPYGLGWEKGDSKSQWPTPNWKKGSFLPLSAEHGVVISWNHKSGHGNYATQNAVGSGQVRVDLGGEGKGDNFGLKNEGWGAAVSGFGNMLTAAGDGMRADYAPPGPTPPTAQELQRLRDAIAAAPLAPPRAAPPVATPAPAPAPTTTTASTFDSAASRASLLNLQAPPKQPSSVAVDGMRMAQLDAVIESWESKMDTLNELGQEKQMKIQLLMDRYQQAMSMQSNLAKKISDVTSGIIANMK